MESLTSQPESALYMGMILGNISDENHTEKACNDTCFLTKICLSVNVTFLFGHLATLVCFQKTRLNFGIYYCLDMLLLCFSTFCTLLSCFISVETAFFRSVSMLANFGYISHLLVGTLSAAKTCHSVRSLGYVETLPVHYVYSVLHQPDAFKACRDLGLLLLMFVTSLCLVLPNLHAVTSQPISAFHARVTGLFCSFQPTSGSLYFLLVPALILILSQLAIVGFASRALYRFDQRPLNKEELRCLNQHLFTSLKLAISQLIVWTLALIAVLCASVTIWHTFNLSGSLQSIYFTVSCLLSREVLGELRSYNMRMMDNRPKLNYDYLRISGIRAVQPGVEICDHLK